MINGKVIKALIVVRANSKRVKNKNNRPFADTTLLKNKIMQLRRIESIDSILVNSEDEEMLRLSRELGCETFKRDLYYASDEVTANETYYYFAKNIQSDIIVFANVTNPLVNDDTIRYALKEYFGNRKEFDSVNTASYIKKFLYDGNGPINWNVDFQPRSQDLPDIMALNFAVNVIERDLMMERKSILGKRPLLIPIDEVEAIDIDTEFDFWLAELIYKNRNRNSDMSDCECM